MNSFSFIIVRTRFLSRSPWWGCWSVMRHIEAPDWEITAHWSGVYPKNTNEGRSFHVLVTWKESSIFVPECFCANSNKYMSESLAAPDRRIQNQLPQRLNRLIYSNMKYHQSGEAALCLCACSTNTWLYTFLCFAQWACRSPQVGCLSPSLLHPELCVLLSAAASANSRNECENISNNSKSCI